MIMLVGGPFSGLTNFEVIIVLAWITLPVIAIALIVRRSVRVLKTRLERWHSARLIFFVATMMKIGKSGENLLKHMDGGHDTPSNEDIAIFRAVQRECRARIIVAVVLIAIALSLAHQFAR